MRAFAAGARARFTGENPPPLRNQKISFMID